jgi:Xaa-Pro aminopeptidase
MLRYKAPKSDLFKRNRDRFTSYLPDGALAIFNANDIMPTNGDGTMPFKQNSDLYYLTGVDQEESILVLFPHAFHAAHRCMLFLLETNPHIARWEGEKLNKEQAKAVSGIDSVYWISEFDAILKTVMSQATHVFLNQNEHYRRNNPVQTRDDRFRERMMRDFPLHEYERCAPIMHALRAIKQPEEIEVMQKAADIAVDGYKRVLKMLKPGVMEYEIEAEFIHEFTRQGSRGFAYTPIIASGANACVLHYIENSRVCNDGDLILLDVGAEYGNYNSDITRTFPVNGRFTTRQKDIYNAVLRVKKAAMELLRPGNQLHEYHREVGALMTDELLRLKLIDQTDVKNEDPKWPAYKKYFMHGTSHYIGLDVHDVGLWTVQMEVGNAFTVEPGIYIPEENIGIRIEDDVIITHDGLLNLTEGVPEEVEAIEALMHER